MLEPLPILEESADKSNIDMYPASMKRIKFLFLVLSLFSTFMITSVQFAGATELPYIGEDCLPNKFESEVGTSVQNGLDRIYLMCAPSTNNSNIWVWSQDNNAEPVATFPKGEIAYGRDYGDLPDTCKQDATNSDFVSLYGRTYCDEVNHVWANVEYEKNIVPTAQVPPIKSEIAPSAGGTSENPTTNRKATNTGTTFLLLGIFAVMMTPASISGINISTSAPSSSFPSNSSNEQGSSIPEYMEINSRRDKKLKAEGGRKKFLRFLLNSRVTLAKYRFFENYLRIRIQKISHFSPGLATILRDGDYLRAIFGSLTFILYPVAIFIGIFNFMDVQSKADNIFLPSFIGLAIMIAIGVIDSLAGAVAGAVFVVLVFISNISTMGQVAEPKRYFSTLVSVFLISCAPPLFAGAFRKFDGLHKDPSRNWNYAIDYLLSPLVTGWMVWKILQVISELAGTPYELPNTASRIAELIWFLLVIRYFFEHYVARNWSDRLNEMIPDEVEQSKFYTVVRYVLKIFWIWLLISSVKSFSNEPLLTPMILALFAIPGVIKVIWQSPPAKLGRLNLRGAPKIAILFLLGIGITQFLKNPNMSSYQVQILGISLLPLLYFSTIEALTEEHTYTPRYFVENRRGVLLYRILGSLIYVFIAGNILYSVYILK